MQSRALKGTLEQTSRISRIDRRVDLAIDSTGLLGICKKIWTSVWFSLFLTFSIFYIITRKRNRQNKQYKPNNLLSTYVFQMCTKIHSSCISEEIQTVQLKPMKTPKSDHRKTSQVHHKFQRILYQIKIIFQFEKNTAHMYCSCRKPKEYTQKAHILSF